MYAKLSEDGKIIYPPNNSGNIMNCHVNPEWLAENGYEDHPASWFAEHNPVPEYPAITTCTRMQLIEFLKEKHPDWYTKLRDAIRNDEEIEFWWLTVNELNRNHPLLVEYCQRLGVSDQTIDMICKEMADVIYG